MKIRSGEERGGGGGNGEGRSDAKRRSFGRDRPTVDRPRPRDAAIRRSRRIMLRILRRPRPGSRRVHTHGRRNPPPTYPRQRLRNSFPSTARAIYTAPTLRAKDILWSECALSREIGSIRMECFSCHSLPKHLARSDRPTSKMTEISGADLRVGFRHLPSPSSLRLRIWSVCLPRARAIPPLLRARLCLHDPARAASSYSSALKKATERPTSMTTTNSLPFESGGAT